jgi:hypothetical protein
MEAYCVFLMGNFIALPAFQADFGDFDPISLWVYVWLVPSQVRSDTVGRLSVASWS